MNVPEKPLRVLINGLHSKSGGGVTYLHNILPELAKDKGLELHLVLHTNQLPLFEKLADHARLHIFAFRDDPLHTMAWEQFTLPLLSRVMNADVVFSPANYGPIFAPNLVILLRNSLAVAQEENRFSKRFYWAAMEVMTKVSLCFARRAVAVSEFAIGTLTTGLMKRLRNKIRIIHHGVSSALSADGRPRERFLLAVGDLYIQKNYHNLLVAFAHLTLLHPDLTLRIAGKPLDDGYAQTLNRLVQQHGLEGKVQFMGNVSLPQLVDLYRSCALFVFPSTVETFGNPLVEAMACGAPVVCSKTAAMPEIADDAAEYFSPASSDDMAAVIDRVLQDDSLRAEMTTRSLERVKRFSWARSAADLAAVLRDAKG